MDRTLLTALVLAGGAASRLGGSKCDRDVGGRTLLERSLDLAQAVADDVVLLTGPARRPGAGLDLALAGRPGVRCVADGEDLLGPLAGLSAGLAAARCEWAVLLACDMPFVTPAAVAALARRASRCEADAVVIRTPAGLAPMPALYHRRVLAALAARRGVADLSLQGLLAAVPRREAGPDELGEALDGRLLDNVNTPDDLERARAAALDRAGTPA